MSFCLFVLYSDIYITVWNKVTQYIHTIINSKVSQSVTLSRLNRSVDFKDIWYEYTFIFKHGYKLLFTAIHQHIRVGKVIDNSRMAGPILMISIVPNSKIPIKLWENEFKWNLALNYSDYWERTYNTLTFISGQRYPLS